MKNALDASIIAAHDKGDGARIAELYGQAAEQAEADGHIDEACFFWVNAYVFALEAGLEDAELIRSHLVRYGREA